MTPARGEKEGEAYLCSTSSAGRPKIQEVIRETWEVRKKVKFNPLAFFCAQQQQHKRQLIGWDDITSCH